MTAQTLAANRASTPSCRSGFSLVELLIALVILVITGGMAVVVLLQSFRLWEHGVERSRAVVSRSDWHRQMRRDVSSMVAGAGFEGDAAQCRFMSLQFASANAVELLSLSYKATPEGLACIRQPARGSTVEEHVFDTARGIRLAYAAADDPVGEWRTDWSNPSNAPARLKIDYPARNDVLRHELILERRTP